MKFRVDKTAESPLCRMCGVKNEKLSHIVSKCKILDQKEYKKRHDNVCRYIHWRLCKKHDFEGTPEWHERKPGGVIDSEVYKVLWNFRVQCDIKIEARRPGIVIIDKTKKELGILDVTIPGDIRVNEREIGKIEKYQILNNEISRM